MSDTLLLADIFENFRKLTMKNYGLDSAAFYTAPGLAFDAALKICKAELELLLTFERAIRGEITHCIKRYVAANNPYMENFDEA